ncbi:MAG: hypothetical protein JWP97_4090 [Labilithrix sp.]|nr:hypothetical protein [Labilithrix sp.]
MRATPEVAARAIAALLGAPSPDVVVVERPLGSLADLRRPGDPRVQRFQVLAADSAWCIVWGEETLAAELAQAADLAVAHAEHHATHLELVLHEGRAGVRRSVAVTAEDRVDTLAIGAPLEGELDREALEKGVRARDTAGTLGRLLASTGLPDALSPASYVPGASFFTVTAVRRERPEAVPEAPVRVAHADDETPPDYLAPYARKPKKTGPSVLLADGSFCGHGEPRFGVWDLAVDGSKELVVELPLPEEEKRLWPVVRVASAKSTKEKVLAYDSRAVVSAAGSGAASGKPTGTKGLACPSCTGRIFQVSVGFEIPDDATSPEDTSWFALAVRCLKCRREEVVWQHESE